MATDGEEPAAAPVEGAALAEAAPPKPKRTRKRAAAKPKSSAAETVEAPPAPVLAPPEAKPPAPLSAKPIPVIAPPVALNSIMMEQTAEGLAQLSMNLTEAMTRANQVFSTAFLDQTK